jgi:hypothetical protein
MLIMGGKGFIGDPMSGGTNVKIPRSEKYLDALFGTVGESSTDGGLGMGETQSFFLGDFIMEGGENREAIAEEARA